MVVPELTYFLLLATFGDLSAQILTVVQREALANVMPGRLQELRSSVGYFPLGSLFHAPRSWECGFSSPGSCQMTFVGHLSPTRA